MSTQVGVETTPEVAVPLLTVGKAQAGANISMPFEQIWMDDADNISRRGAPMSDNDVKELAESVKQYGGLLHPFTVRDLTSQEEASPDKPKKATVKVMAGFGRYKAIALLLAAKECPYKATEIPVQLSSIEGDAKYASIDVNLSENLKRKDADPVAIGMALVEIHEKTGEDFKEIAKRYGKTGPWATQHVGLTKLRKDVQKKISNGTIPMKLARMLGTLDEAEQDKWIASVESGVSATEASQSAVNKRGKSKRGRKKNAESTSGGGISAKAAIRALDEWQEGLAADEKPTKGKENVGKVLALFGEFLNGKMSAKVMANRLGELV